MAGLLFVLCEPGPAVSEEELNDWLDNEHIPLRLPIPGFQSWSRWTAVDGAKPAHASLYDLSHPSVLTEPPYTDLAATRSEREASILARFALLDRRTYTLREPVYPPAAGAAYDPAKPGPFISVVEIAVKPEGQDEFDRWYEEEHIPMIAKAPGWLRSRRFVLEDAGATGPEAKEGRPPRNLAVHEWESPAAFESAEFKAAVSTPWMAKLRETALVEARRRVFKFVRSWDRE